MRAKFEVEKLQAGRVNEAGTLLARAFFDDPLMTYALPDQEHRRRALAPLLIVGVRLASRVARCTPAADPCRVLRSGRRRPAGRSGAGTRGCGRLGLLSRNAQAAQRDLLSQARLRGRGGRRPARRSALLDHAARCSLGGCQVLPAFWYAMLFDRAHMPVRA